MNPADLVWFMLFCPEKSINELLFKIRRHYPGLIDRPVAASLAVLSLGTSLLTSTLTVMLLTKLQRNKLYESIVNANLEPAEFDLKNTRKKVTITHSSGSTFKFSRSMVERVEGATAYEYDIKASVTGGRVLYDSGFDIDSLTVVYFPDWLSEIRLTVGVPDYWDELKRGRHMVAEFQQESVNTPFTQDEQTQISAQLQKITEQLKYQFELTNEQIERVEEWQDEAVEASKHMGRKDWRIYFLGSITALIITATVAAGVGEHIFIMVINGLSHLFTGGSEPPPIPPPTIA